MSFTKKNSNFVKQGIDTYLLRVILNSTKRVKKEKTQYNEKGEKEWQAETINTISLMTKI